MINQAEQLKQFLADVKSQNDHQVLLYATTNIEADHLPPLYDLIQSMDEAKTLDVVVYCRGGQVVTARRIMLLLREKFEVINFIVPYYCESAGTIMALGANAVIAGSLAHFSPIDPQLHGGAGDAQSAISFMDICQFPQMGQDWFGVDEDDCRPEALALLCNQIFPPTLTAFYRSAKEVKAIALELIANQLPTASVKRQEEIVDMLMTGFHSHHFALSSEDLSNLGILVERHRELEATSWQLAKIIHKHLGAGRRQLDGGTFIDAVLATDSSVIMRQNKFDEMAPNWREV